MDTSKPIALFYHVYMGGGHIPVNTDNVFRIVTEQVEALHASDLINSAARFVVGVAGQPGSHVAIQELIGPKCETHPATGQGELPTMKFMQDYARLNPDHLCCYFHTKAVCHNGAPTFEAWRHCMQRVVINRWRECVAALMRGYDTVGAHWLTPGQHPFIGPVPYWGGNFFWATAKYLNTLPEIDVNADRYQAEVWIGKSPRKPNVMDFVKHFPMTGCV